MFRTRKWLLGIAACTVLATLFIACSDDDDDAGDVTPAATAPAVADTPPAGEDNVLAVALSEFSVVPDKANIAAGSITIRATNNGPDDEHELVIIRSDLSPNALPTADDGSVPEDEVDFVDEVEGLAVGESNEITVDLGPGKYVLICNIVQEEPDGTIEAHYERGMRAGLTVE